MTEIRNVKVYGMENAVIRSGLPMTEDFGECDYEVPDLLDWNRAIDLASKPLASGHSNFLKGITVNFDIKYPEYLSPQIQRYHWMEIISSMSKMHKITSIGVKGNCNIYVLPEIEDIVQRLIDEYNANKSYLNFMKVMSNTPMGFEKWMSITTNYLQLKTIFHQRKNHKLKEDWGSIIDMIKELPMAEEFIINKRG